MTQICQLRRQRLAWRLYYVFACACLVIIAALLRQLHSLSAADYRAPGAGPDVQAQLDWLGAKQRAGGGEETQAWYPEGYFFAHAIYGAALVNQVLFDPDDVALRARNAAEVEWVLARLESSQGTPRFPRARPCRTGSSTWVGATACWDDWLAFTRAHLDPQTGLLPHRIDAHTGETLDGARSSSLVMALGFLPEASHQVTRAG
jgi:hypothetical protein